MMCETTVQPKIKYDSTGGCLENVRIEVVAIIVGLGGRNCLENATTHPSKARSKRSIVIGTWARGIKTGIST
jgi:hypothetical protein